MSIHAANPTGGEKTIARATSGLGVKARSVSSEPYFTAAAPAKAPTVSLPKKTTVLVESGGSSVSALPPGIAAFRVGILEEARNVKGSARGRSYVIRCPVGAIGDILNVFFMFKDINPKIEEEIAGRPSTEVLSG